MISAVTITQLTGPEGFSGMDVQCFTLYVHSAESYSCYSLQELGLPEDPNVPVLAFIGRLDEQKGVDLIRDSFDWLMSEGVQLILLGSGREDLENSLRYSLASKKTLPSF